RVYEAIEVEPQISGVVDAVVGQAGVEKTSGAVGGGFAGGVAQDEKEVGGLGVFEDGLKTIGLSIEGELGGTGGGHVSGGAKDGGNIERLGRRVGNPTGANAI